MKKFIFSIMCALALAALIMPATSNPNFVTSTNSFATAAEYQQLFDDSDVNVELYDEYIGGQAKKKEIVVDQLRIQKKDIVIQSAEN